MLGEDQKVKEIRKEFVYVWKLKQEQDRENEVQALTSKIILELEPRLELMICQAPLQPDSSYIFLERIMLQCIYII